MQRLSYQVRHVLDCECVKHHWERHWTVFHAGKPVADFPWLENFNDVRAELLKRHGTQAGKPA